MLSLLDGHFQFLVFPEECNYLNYSDENAKRYGIVSCLYKEFVKRKAKILERMRGNATDPDYASMIGY